MADEILQTDITNESLEKLTESQVEELGESGLEDLLEQSAEFAFDMVPVLPSILITITEGRAVLSGSATLQMSLQRGAKRLGRATAYNALGLGLSPSSAPPRFRPSWPSESRRSGSATRWQWGTF